MMGSTSLMIRKPALEVLHHLKGMSEDAKPPPKFIFCILLPTFSITLKKLRDILQYKVTPRNRSVVFSILKLVCLAAGR